MFTLIFVLQFAALIILYFNNRKTSLIIFAFAFIISVSVFIYHLQTNLNISL